MKNPTFVRRKISFCRLKNRASNGESIAEVLAASLMISLAMTALITMVMASFRMIRNSEASMTSFYEEKNSYETMVPSDSGLIVIEFPSGDSTDNDSVSVKIRHSTNGTFQGYDINTESSS